jgi:predicted dehydrogenase
MTTLNAPTVLIGAGQWGKTVARKAHSLPWYQIHGVYDPSNIQSMPLVSELNTAKYYDNQRAACTGCTHAIIATPAHTDRYTQLAICLDAGIRNIRIEKPISLEYDEALELIDLANQASATLTVGHTSVYYKCVPYLAGLASSLAKQNQLKLTVRRMSRTSPRHTTTPIFDLSVHCLALHRAIRPNEWKDAAPIVTHAEHTDNMSWFALSDGSIFEAAFNSEKDVRGVGLNETDYYDEISQRIVAKGVMYHESFFDPLGVELAGWASGKRFDPLVAAEIVGVAATAQRLHNEAKYVVG